MYSTAHRTRRHSRCRRRHRRRRHRPTNRRARFPARSLRPGGRSLRPSPLPRFSLPLSIALFPSVSRGRSGSAARFFPPSPLSLPWSACPMPSPRPPYPARPSACAPRARRCFPRSSVPRARDAVPCWVLGNEESWWAFRYPALRRTSSTAPKLWMGRSMGHNSSPQFALSVQREGK